MFLKEDNVAMIVFDASQHLQDPVKDRDRHKDPYTQKSVSPTTTGWKLCVTGCNRFIQFAVRMVDNWVQPQDLCLLCSWLPHTLI